MRLQLVDGEKPLPTLNVRCRGGLARGFILCHACLRLELIEEREPLTPNRSLEKGDEEVRLDPRRPARGVASVGAHPRPGLRSPEPAAGDENVGLDRRIATVHL